MILLHAVVERPVSLRELHRIEAAVVEIVNGPLHRDWGTPTIRWAHTGLKVIIRGWARMAMFCGPDAEACHWYDNTGPYAVTTYDSGAISHEVEEMLVDPWANRYINGQLVEICDPVYNDFVTSTNTEAIATYVTPRYYVHDHR